MSRLNWTVFLAAILYLNTTTLFAATSGTTTILLEDIPVGKVIQTGELKFVKVGQDSYMAIDSKIISCGAHANPDLSNLQRCLCDTGYYYDRKGTNTHAITNGSCDYIRCDVATTTGTYVLPSESCTCSAGRITNNYTSSYIANSGNTCAKTYTIYGCNNPQGALQSWQGCSNLATSTATTVGDTACLIDTRNNFSYMVRKFPDGLCWLVNNLAYGNCQQYSTYATTTTGTNYPLGTGLYGVCVDPGSNASNKYGYLYNYQAAVQDANSYYNKDNQPGEPRTGLCPAGWYLPRATGSFSYANLYNSVGNSLAFFQPSGPFNSVFAGVTSNTGAISDQGTRVSYWTSTQINTTSSHDWVVYTTSTADSARDKSRARSIRCTLHPCGANATLSGSTCICNDGYKTASNTRTFTINSGQSCTAFSGNLTLSTATLGTMQQFTESICDNTPTPTGGNYVQIGKYRDSRAADKKGSGGYTIRKFADGHCWMAESLMFGNNCSGANYNSYYQTSTSGIIASGYYGTCNVNNTGYDGYMYNWQAVVNNATAAYNSAYSGRVNGTTEATHDICPLGWHVPTGKLTGEFTQLAQKVQGTTLEATCSNTNCSTVYNWFRTSGANNWNASTNSTLAGHANGSSYTEQGSYARWWTSTPGTANTDSYYLSLSGSAIQLERAYHRYRGEPVRCIADYTTK